jgi:hypothetical protein
MKVMERLAVAFYLILFLGEYFWWFNINYGSGEKRKIIKGLKRFFRPRKTTHENVHQNV